MGYCAPRGIPHSHFLGGPDVWTQEDREKALAWHQRELERCPHCGTHPDEWDPDKGGSPHAREPGLRHCRGCEVSAQAGDLHEQHTKKKGHRRGVHPVMNLPRPAPTI